MKRAIIILTNYEPAYLRIWEHLVRREGSTRGVPTVLDATLASAVPVDTFHRGALRLFGLSYPGNDLTQRFEAAGAEVCTLSRTDAVPLGPLDHDAEEILAISVQSAMISYFRTDRPDLRKRRVRRTAAALAAEGRRIFRAVSQLLIDDPDIDLVYVPNGRAPNQKMATVAAKRAGVATMHVEKGETADGTYLQSYAPQDRVASQEATGPVLEGLSKQRIDEIAQGWLDRRVPSKASSNEFSALWSEGSSPDLSATGEKVAGFFTSSQDEFQFLGPEWQLHDWDDQFVAFDRMMTEFENSGYTCYLRVHPNLATKAHECFVRERDGIRWLAAHHPHLNVIWHDATANTYNLLEHTDAVVVWDSTVGLEASAMGIPVWTVATSRYGLVADIREVLSESDLRENGVQPWQVDAHGAKRFIAYLMLRDEQMSADVVSWLPWAGRRPIGVSVAAALVSGGSPYKRDALQSIVDVYRHRSVSANRLALGRRR